MKVNILGTEYGIYEQAESEDGNLAECDGYCDKTIKKIVVTKKPNGSTLGDWEVYRNKVLRHEIIHAYLFESGLHENFQMRDGHDETIIDWMAVQFPKMLKTFEEAGCM